MKPIAFVILCLLMSKLTNAQSALPKGNPIIFVDSVRFTTANLQQINPDEIATVSVYKESAINILPEAKDGLVYIETKKFAKARYQRFFKSISKAYEALLKLPTAENDIQYILNGKVLTENFEGDLASVNQTNFKGISIISASELIKTYSVQNKKTGIVIIADTVIKAPIGIALR